LGLIEAICFIAIANKLIKNQVSQLKIDIFSSKEPKIPETPMEKGFRFYYFECAS